MSAFGYLLIPLALGAALTVYRVYKRQDNKDKDQGDQPQQQDQDKKGYNLRTRPLAPPVDLQTYTYM